MVTAHHHRSTTKSANKPFKSRHASKSFLKNLNKGATLRKFPPQVATARMALKGSERGCAHTVGCAGKVDDTSASGARRTGHQQMMSKIDRRNKARQIQSNKQRDHERETRIFKGRDAAPRIVAVVPLCDDVSSSRAVQQLLKSLDIAADVPETGIFTTWCVRPLVCHFEASCCLLGHRIERFKQRIQWVVMRKDLLAVLDGCKAADFVLFVVSANTEVDSFGESIIRGVEAQGVSTTVVAVQVSLSDH